MTIDAGLQVKLTRVAGTHFKLTPLAVKKLCQLAQTFILQHILVEKRRDYCRHLGQRFEIKDWIAIGNFLFFTSFFLFRKPSIVLDESLNLLHSPVVERGYFSTAFLSFFAEIVSFQTAFPFLFERSDTVSVPALIVCEQGQRRVVQSW